MQTELIFKNVVEGLASIGESSLSSLIRASGEVGENVLWFLWQFAGEVSLKSLQNDTANAAEVQKQLLLEILNLHKDTEYGKIYNFNTIQSIDEFCRVHPLTNYENYRSLIESIANSGNFNQLVAEPIVLFQQPSEITEKAKLIPRTNRQTLSFMKAFQIPETVKATYFQNRKPFAQKHRGMVLVNTQPIQLTPSGIPKGTGTNGGFGQSLKKFKLIQDIARLKFSSPIPVFSISDYETACYCHLLFALIEPKLAFIAANSAINILQGIRILEEKWQQLVNDIQSGQIDEELKLEINIRDELQSYFKPNSERAEALKVEFEKGMDSILPRIWSELSYIECSTYGSMQLYQQQLKNYAGEIPLYFGFYVAPEAWLGVNLEPHRDSPAYVITPHSAFFEFISEKEIDVDNPSPAKLTSLKVGDNYEVVVTTVAGLYRYRLGDIIKCVGYYNQSPIVEFLYHQT